MVDYYRTPDTQRDFAAKHDQDVRKVTSFADATKLSMETTVLANATGFGVARRGMTGPACGYVRDLAKLLPAEAMLDGGIVDYSVGAAPHTGGFVVVHEENPYKQTQLAYYKLGDGPFYVFYTPFHLPHIQLPSTIARAVIHSDPTVAPLGGPVVRGRHGRQAALEGRRAPRRRRRLLQLRADREPRYRARRSTRCRSRCRKTACCCGTSPRTRSSSFDDVRMPPPRLSDELWQEQQRRWPAARDARTTPFSARQPAWPRSVS